MGMYTEFIFEGETKPKLDEEIKELLNYFFDENSAFIIEDCKAPEHEFFQCSRWRQIGHIGSYYFSPFSLRYSQEHIQNNGSKHVFLRCDLKNYDSEIEKFLDWIKPYMREYWGYYLYEEDEVPTFFKAGR